MFCCCNGFIMVKGGVERKAGYYLLSSTLTLLKPPTDMCNPHNVLYINTQWQIYTQWTE